MSELLERNLGLDLVRVTEAAAIQAARWMGLGKRIEADEAATQAMLAALNTLPMDGTIVIGEEAKSGIHSPLDSGNRVGNRQGPTMDVLVDPIDGTNLLIHGKAGAISVAGAAPAGSMWAPSPAAYMEKIVVDREVSDALVSECMDAPVGWTLALIARVKDKRMRDLVVFMLDRPRHRHLIEEIRITGARVALFTDGDIAGAIMAATPDSNIDVLMGIGGVSEGVMAACAVKALGGSMLVRLAPQGADERQLIQDAGLDVSAILTADDMIRSSEVFFAATGVTDGRLLDGVRYRRDSAETHSLVLRSETGTRRLVRAEHRFSD